MVCINKYGIFQVIFEKLCVLALNHESNRIFQKNTVFIDRDQLYIDEERSALEITFFYRINK